MKVRYSIKLAESSQQMHAVAETSDLNCVLGRDQVDIITSDEKCSRRHAKLYFEAKSGLRIRDLGSKNGTYVNNVRITDFTVSIGDRIRIGRSVITILAVSCDDTRVEEGMESSFSKDGTGSGMKETYGESSIVIVSWPDLAACRPPESGEDR